jgi:hypothetical protein
MAGKRSERRERRAERESGMWEGKEVYPATCGAAMTAPIAALRALPRARGRGCG